MKKGLLDVLREKTVWMLRGKKTPAPEGMQLHFSDGAKIREDNLRKIEELEKLLAQSRQSATEPPPSSGTKRALNLQHLALDPELPG